MITKKQVNDAKNEKRKNIANTILSFSIQIEEKVDNILLSGKNVIYWNDFTFIPHLYMDEYRYQLYSFIQSKYGNEWRIEKYFEAKDNNKSYKDIELWAGLKFL